MNNVNTGRHIHSIPSCKKRWEILTSCVSHFPAFVDVWKTPPSLSLVYVECESPQSNFLVLFCDRNAEIELVFRHKKNGMGWTDR